MLNLSDLVLDYRQKRGLDDSMEEAEKKQGDRGSFSLEVERELNTICTYYFDPKITNRNGNRVITIYDSIGSELFDILESVCAKNKIKSLLLNPTKNEELIQILNQIESPSHLEEDKSKKYNEKEDETSKSDNIQKDNEKISMEIELKERQNRKILLLNYPHLVNKTEYDISNQFIEDFQKKITESSKRSTQVPLFLMIIIEENNQIPREVASLVDFSISIPYPDKIKRLEIVDKLLSDYGVHTVDINELSELTEGWNVKDLQRLINTGYMKWKILNITEMEKKTPINEVKNAAMIDEKSLLKIKTDAEESKTERTADQKELTDIKSSEGEQVKNFMEAVTKNEKKSKKTTSNPTHAENNKNHPDKIENQLNEVKKGDNASDSSKMDMKKDEDSMISLKNTKLDYVIPFTVEIFRTLISTKQVLPLREFISKDLMKIPGVLNGTNNIAVINSVLGRAGPTNLPGYSASSLKNKQWGEPSSFSTETNFDASEKNDFQILRSVNTTELNSFTSTQFYQLAASQKFDELVSTLEKLDQGKQLDAIDRNLLSDYSFILKDEPKKALVRLTNAKNRIDKIKKITKDTEKIE